jgi:hypothetical protein
MLVAKVELQRAEGVERSPIEADVLLQSLENELAFIDRYLSSARHLERFMSENCWSFHIINFKQRITAKSLPAFG